MKDVWVDQATGKAMVIAPEKIKSSKKSTNKGR
jgi:hypothetical protein